MGKIRPKKAKTHEGRRLEVCLVCNSRAQRPMSQEFQENLNTFFGESVGNPFDFKDPRVPLGICDTCRREELKELPFLCNFFDFSFVEPDSTNCNCFICAIAKGSPKSSKKFHGPKKNL